LIPIASKPRPQPAIEAVDRLIHQLDAPEGQVTLLHVGSSSEAPTVRLPAGSRWNWETLTRPGEPVPVILEAASTQQTDLIVMTTDGPDGFLDGLRGTTSERVLRQARCPVLILPAGTIRV
jgi:nucleotide-binding universal stress UspA family protein